MPKTHRRPALPQGKDPIPQPSLSPEKDRRAERRLPPHSTLASRKSLTALKKVCLLIGDHVARVRDLHILLESTPRLIRQNLEFRRDPPAPVNRANYMLDSAIAHGRTWQGLTLKGSGAMETMIPSDARFPARALQALSGTVWPGSTVAVALLSMGYSRERLHGLLDSLFQSARYHDRNINHPNLNFNFKFASQCLMALPVADSLRRAPQPTYSPALTPATFWAMREQ